MLLKDTPKPQFALRPEAPKQLNAKPAPPLSEREAFTATPGALWGPYALRVAYYQYRLGSC